MARLADDPGRNQSANIIQDIDIKSLFAGLAFALMWSSAFTSARILVTNAPPLSVSSLRFFVSGVIALMIAGFLKQSFRLTPAQWRLTILFGICQNAIYLGLNFVAMQTIEASLAAIIASSLPLLVALIGWVFLRERIAWLGVVGLLAGIIGVVVIMGSRLTQGVDPLGIGLCVVGALALALATLSVRGASAGGNLMVVVGFQMLVGAAVLFVPALTFETWVVDWSPQVVAALLYSIFIPGLLATVIWFWLVRRIGAVRAATFHFLNPFLGVLVAALLLGESVGLLDILGVAIITLGILAVQLSKPVR